MDSSNKNQDLIDYFISKTDERFNAVEGKLDELLKFKWQMVGGSIVASFAGSVAVSLLIAIVVQVFFTK